MGKWARAFAHTHVPWAMREEEGGRRDDSPKFWWSEWPVWPNLSWVPSGGQFGQIWVGCHLVASLGKFVLGVIWWPVWANLIWVPSCGQFGPNRPNRPNLPILPNRFHLNHYSLNHKLPTVHYMGFHLVSDKTSPDLTRDISPTCNWFSFEKSQNLCLTFHNCTTLATDVCLEEEDCVSGMGRWVPSPINLCESTNVLYRVTHQVGKWVGLTLIWDVPPSCLSSM